MNKNIYYVILILIIIVAYLFNLNYNENIMIDTRSADIIIIGLGTSGSIMARRLHDNLPNLKILVLERGQNRSSDPNIYNISKGDIAAYNSTYSSVLKSDNPNVQVTVGSMYGGSSSHNYGLVVHGSPEYYNQLGKILNINNFLPYFKKVEKFTGQSENMSIRGINGKLQVSQLPTKIDIINKIIPFVGLAYNYKFKIISESINVLNNSGPLRASDSFSNIINKAIQDIKQIPIVEDYNSGLEICTCATPQLFVDSNTGLRCSTNVGYLPPGYIRMDNTGYSTSNNNNLHIVPNCIVDKIISNKVNWFDNHGNIQSTSLNENGRVILCAGSIYNPLILQKSYLNNIIGQQSYSNIGKNLTTHYGCTMIVSVEADNNENFYFSSGPLAFLQRQQQDVRNWQIITGGSSLVNTKLLDSVNVNYKENQKNNQNLKYFTFLLWNLKPRSRGQIYYDPTNPLVPQIDLNFWSDGDLSDPDSDLSNVLDGLKFLNQIVKKMQQTYPTMTCVYPPQTVFDKNNNNLLVPYIKNGISMTDHYSSTCSLNKVVNPFDFKLIGTNNIHIIDASVFPIISNGNTEFPVAVVTEIAAERITTSILNINL